MSSGYIVNMHHVDELLNHSRSKGPHPSSPRLGVDPSCLDGTFILSYHSHGQKMTKDWIVDLIPVLEMDLLQNSDYIGPQSVVVVQLIHHIIIPMMNVKGQFTSQDPSIAHLVNHLRRNNWLELPKGSAGALPVPR